LIFFFISVAQGLAGIMVRHQQCGDRDEDGHEDESSQGELYDVFLLVMKADLQREVIL